MIQQNGIARVPQVSLTASLTFPGLLSTPARVDRVEKFAGSSIGSAVVQFRLPPAQEALVGYGETASISVGGTVIFRGTVGTAPVYVSSDADFVEAVLYDDKWGMQANIVGQRGIGTLAAPDRGFSDVGFDVIFNRDGRPNKKPSALDFCTGSAAEYWTLADVLRFLFSHYIDSDVATLSGSLNLGDAFDREPSHLALVGQPALAAVDLVCQTAGVSWGLKAGQDASSFVLVKPGGNTERKAFFFDPKGGRVVTEAGEWHASQANIQGSILHARDIHQARSGRIVVETTLRSFGTTPGLVKATFTDKRFSARFVTDVTKYSAHGLGADLSAGSAPKPWLSTLLTRISSSGGYVAAAAMESNLDSPRAEIPVWVSADGTESKLRLAVGGYEIDFEKGLIDFESQVEFLDASQRKQRLPINWSEAGVAITVAVVLEVPQFVESEEASSYLPRPFHVVIDKPDLVPERRLNALLPKLSTSNPDDTETVAATLEKYVDVEARLQDAVDASLASMPKVETPMTVEFGLFPLCEIGDALKAVGRDLGTTGDEVIIAIRYAVHDAYRTSVEATNVTAAINPDRFVKR